MSKFKYLVTYYEVHPDAPKKKFLESSDEKVFFTSNRKLLRSPVFDSIEECNSFVDSLSHFNYLVTIYKKSL